MANFLRNELISRTSCLVDVWVLLQTKRKNRRQGMKTREGFVVYEMFDVIDLDPGT